MKHKVNSSWVSYGYDGMGRKLYAEYSESLLFPQGYFTFDETTGKAVPHYFLKDHLGSVRVVTAADGTAEQVNHYYAFGGLMGDSSGGDVQKYKYNGSHHSSSSGYKYNIYKKQKSDKSYEYTCAYAGTDADSGVGDFLKDAANDAVNYLGGMAPQYAEAIVTSLKISGESELTFVGHSLGGGLAALSSMVTGKDAITFNAASVTGFLKVAGMAISSFRGGMITQYRSVGNNFLSGDPVNTFQDVTRRPSQGRVILVKVGKNFSHGIQDIINAFHRKEKQ